MSDEVLLTDNWTQNWQASIAVKITSIVLWVLISVVFGVSVYLFDGIEENLRVQYADSADKLAYRVTDAVARAETIDDQRLAEEIGTLFDPAQFSGITLRHGEKRLEVGETDAAAERLSRQVHLTEGEGSESIYIDLFYPELHKTVQRKRNYMVITIFVSMLCFGIFLTWAIRITVHKPLQTLVTATRKISSGQQDVRLDMEGQDEFGYLSRFFNQMLDKLMDQQHALQDALDRANAASKAKSGFLANMSHELRTPLNAIIGYSEMLQEDAADLSAPDCIIDLKRIHTSGTHLLSLINDILDLSKIEAGKIELEWTTLPVSELVNDVCATVQSLMARNNNQFVVLCDDALGNIESDQTKLRQILLNLLSNAAKFTDNGIITLTVKRVNQEGRGNLLFAIEDTGIGIPADKLNRLFSEFSQVDSSASRKYGGTGLGLAISRRFCQMLGGDIQVESVPGKGSTFFTHLPAERRDAQEIASVSDESLGLDCNTPTCRDRFGDDLPGNVPTERRRTVSKVLIIDDDPVVRDLIGRYLAREGFEIRAAENGQEALEIVRDMKPDVITLDIQMPGMDGWTVLKELKAIPELSHVPVVVVSLDDNAQKGVAIGASEFLSKPIRREELVFTIRNLVRKKGLEHSLLVVDDDQATRDLVERSMEGQDITVMHADDGIAGLACVAKHKPGIIILDLNLPRMNGFDFLHELRKRPEWRNIPVVVITAMDLNDKERAELTHTVESILHKGAHMRQNVLLQMKELLLSA